MSDGLVAGQVAVVTGAGSGIGRASALLLAEEGATAVAVCDVREEAARETAAMVEELGAKSLAVAADLADLAAAEQFVSAAYQEFGALHAAVNCAGVNGPLKAIGEYSDDEWSAVSAVNLDAVFRCMRTEVNLMTAGGGGAIVNISSGSAVDPIPNMAVYTATKTGVLGLTRAAAGEYVKHNIRINAVLPGATLTRMLEAHAQTEQGKKQVANAPMGRWGDPREIAQAVVWLLSPRSSYITGVELLVDGGSHAFWY
ncbi:MAG: SDR family oxidoreductase [Actinomycetota bacterium]|nr:MAG: SDR family oxidoreductase [Actinomycetota bacterium]